MRSIILTGNSYGVTEGEPVEVDDDRAASLVEQGRARYADDEAPKRAKGSAKADAES